MKKSMSLVLISVFSGVLTACGGGGSDEGVSYTVASLPQEAEVVITDENGAAVAKSTAQMINGGLAESFINDFYTTASLSSGSSPKTAKDVIDLIREEFMQAQGSLGSVPVGVEGSGSENCPVSGKVSYYLNVSDPDAIFANNGDYGKIVYDHCVDLYDGDFFEQNGVTELKMNQVSASYSDSDLTLKNYTADLEGSFSMYSSSSKVNLREWGETDNFSQKSISITTGDMNFTLDGVVSNLKYNTFTDQYIDGENGASSVSYSYDGLYDFGVNNVFHGALDLQTMEPFVVYYGDDFPSYGQMIINGASGSVRVTIYSAEEVLIEVDADDNGVYEYSETMTWAELIA
ncbi:MULTISPECIES: hypothetical protein [Thiomicrorhabdus]|uniref:Lipoprotein n=1 Tax=Thiomicrorhabdus heinhorstiae TaxID=2748010 RepID=A0ABS0BTA3_9GAMM|nr:MULTISPECIES: hypothetical protein [Thiomicrorhabdus]MBF6057073.1 hypothetical protein [Thiomicrorhabdus heinhorstiae]